MRVARLAGIEPSELSRDGLSEDHRTRRAKQRHHRRVSVRVAVSVDRRAPGRRHVVGVVDILDADRDTMKQPGRTLGVAPSRLAEGVVPIEMLPRHNDRLALSDVREAVGDDGL